jgi:hypothetical protein
MSNAFVTAGRLMLARGGTALMARAVAASVSTTTPVISLSDLSGFGHGQSNSNFANDDDGALLNMAQAVSAYLSGTGTPAKYSSGATDVAGAGVYVGVSGYTSFLTYGGDSASVAAKAAYTATGAAMLAYIAGLTGPERASCQFAVLYWGETDSALTNNTGGLAYGDKPVYKAALLNDIAQIRAALGKAASALPVAIFGPPYGTAAGSAMVREAWSELAAVAANNVVWAVQQTYDSITRGDAWSSTTGVETTGSPNEGHRDAVDNVAFYRRGSLAVARAVLTSNGGAAGQIPASLGTGTGPTIAAATLSGATVTLTIAHDGGNDLIVPALASPNGTDAALPAQGVGFSVMDGGTIVAPGSIIRATACVRVDATHLRLTLASAPTNAAASCRLFYPWPGEVWADQPLTEIGRGCAVTDNFGSAVVPAANDLNVLVAAGWRTNMPLCSPMTLANGAATFGIPLT